ncbi:D-specific alpha-keto acid dehydrogenase [Nocardioides albertanoniae]|uniref:D-specific alpha-keto acid dehydrogenase n=1 Tax=Nocardioides albertanoniae TaxID=1175486 RepID=A0A543A970_9ACTN|nr:D-isomer specific 2-hydroxyacid dehydrogenase family protein [Nocardioides albertanoniae]TQL69040.1 D-specific alpha-keto acid dehydrogenase [Nocardioides albertanoniae]
MRYHEPPPTDRCAITVYGCAPDEALLFESLAPRIGVRLQVTSEAISTDNAELAAESRCISVSHKSPISNQTLLRLKQLGVGYISTRSVGFDHIDVEFAESIGITVGNVAYSPDSVADYTLMLMLMAIRQAKSTIRRTDDHDYRPATTRGRELRDLTVGVVGTGRIGAAVIDRLRGFGCDVLAHDIRPRPATEGVAHVDLDTLVERSDIVTLHAPLSAESHHLLDRRRIDRMRPGAYVVNTGRGALVETPALIAALDDGRLGGAALDVIEGEQGIFYADLRGREVPNGWLARLQEMPNVLVSPHIAYFTDHALRDTVENSIVNCREFESRFQHV